MKKVLLMLMTFLAVSLCYSQKKVTTQSTSYVNLTPIDLVISKCGLYNGMSLLSKPKKIEAKRTVSLIDDFIENYTNEESRKVEGALLKKYKRQISDYYLGISSFGETSGAINFADEKSFPSTFTAYNGKLVFVQTGIYSDFAYNTLKLDSRERAMKAVSDIAIPSLYNFKPILDVSEIQFIMIIVGYTAQDFSSESIADKDAETIALLVSKTNLKKYINAEITDEQLLSLSIVYNINKATGNNIKKLST